MCFKVLLSPFVILTYINSVNLALMNENELYNVYYARLRNNQMYVFSIYL